MDKFGFNISSHDDIFRLYKIAPDMSAEETEKQIEETHKRWERMANTSGASQALADRMEMSEKYEAVLRDKALRAELFKEYEKGKEERLASAKECTDQVMEERPMSLKDYEFIKKSTGLRPDEIKEFKAYLSDTYGIMADALPASQNKGNTDAMELALNVIKTNTLFEKAKDWLHLNFPLRERTDELTASDLVGYIGPDNLKNETAAASYVSRRRTEAFNRKQETGSSRIPEMLILYNNLDEGFKEDGWARRSFDAFKAMLKYPSLSARMGSMTENTKDPFEKLYHTSQRKYPSLTREALYHEYYKPVAPSFGLKNEERLEKEMREQIRKRKEERTRERERKRAEEKEEKKEEKKEERKPVARTMAAAAVPVAAVAAYSMGRRWYKPNAKGRAMARAKGMVKGRSV